MKDDDFDKNDENENNFNNIDSKYEFMNWENENSKCNNIQVNNIIKRKKIYYI